MGKITTENLLLYLTYGSMNYDIVKKAPLRMKTDMYENIMNKAIESKLRGFIMIRIDI